MRLQRLAAICLFFSLAPSLPGVCREIGQTNRKDRRHPDGTVGRISMHGYVDYASVSTKPGRFARDVQRLGLGLDLVAGAKMAFQTGYVLFKQDSVRHTLWMGGKFYLQDPLQEGAPRNPDGRLGGVVLSLSLGARFSGNPDAAAERLVDMGATLPVSKHMSLAAGYRHYQEIRQDDAVQGYGGVSLYFSQYSADSAYVNPDGPVGCPVINLFGGASPKGAFCRIAFIFPLQREVSLAARLALERIKSPYQLALTVGVGLSVYSDN